MLLLAQRPISILLSIASGSIGIVIAFYTKNPGFQIISTDLILTSVKSTKRRIPDLPDLVSVDLESISATKITMPKFGENYECLLP
jgi:hypothetical protein